MVLRFIQTVHQLLCYMDIFRFSNNGYLLVNDTYVPTYMLECICTLHQLAGYRWHHVPADGTYSQLYDNPWMCEANKQAYRPTTSLTRWQMNTHVLVPLSTVGLAVEWQCESSNYTRNQRHVAPLEARISLLVFDEVRIGCDY